MASRNVRPKKQHTLIYEFQIWESHPTGKTRVVAELGHSLSLSRLCWAKSLVEGLLDHREAEVVPPMGTVENDAVALRLDDFLEDQLLFLAHDPMRAAVVAVGDDIAGLQVSEQLGQRDRRL